MGGSRAPPNPALEGGATKKREKKKIIGGGGPYGSKVKTQSQNFFPFLTELCWFKPLFIRTKKNFFYLGKTPP